MSQLPGGSSSGPTGRREELPGLDAVVVERLAARWNERGRALWEDVEYLASRFWGAHEPAERALRWHHLVFAVGNFKRDSGRRLNPLSLVEHGPPAVRANAQDFFEVPALGLTVSRDMPESWEVLSSRLPGAALATATTLLSALWPNSHFIDDWRVRSAANGLRADADLPTTEGVELDGSQAPGESFPEYATVRQWLLGAREPLGCELVELERSLYELSRQVASEPGRSWRDYGNALNKKLDEIRGNGTAD